MPYQPLQSNSEDEVITNTESDTVTLSIRPGPKTGHDTYVVLLNGFPSGSNYDFAETIVMQAELLEFRPIIYWSYIKFDSLRLVPANAVVQYARLSLYGTDSSSVYFSKGNSYYPGSPNTKPNTCIVQRVTGSNWDEHTITAQNAPGSATQDEAVLKSSDSQFNYDVNVDVTNMVKEMVANPAQNFGFRLQLKTEVAYRALFFNTSESPDRLKRPKLSIVYTL